MNTHLLMKLVALLCALHATLTFAADELPTAIQGRWSNAQWGGDWSLTQFDPKAKTARVNMVAGGDSCGLQNASGIIKSWDGRALVIEIPQTGRCRFAVTFFLNQSGDAWEGTIDNDVRTVRANGKSRR